MYWMSSAGVNHFTEFGETGRKISNLVLLLRKVIPHSKSDQHQNLTTSRESLFAHAYQVWSTSIRFIELPCGQTDTDRQTDP